MLWICWLMQLIHRIMQLVSDSVIGQNGRVRWSDIDSWFSLGCFVFVFRIWTWQPEDKTQKQVFWAGWGSSGTQLQKMRFWHVELVKMKIIWGSDVEVSQIDPTSIRMNLYGRVESIGTPALFNKYNTKRGNPCYFFVFFVKGGLTLAPTLGDRVLFLARPAEGSFGSEALKLKVFLHFSTPTPPAPTAYKVQRAMGSETPSNQKTKDTCCH